MTTFLQRLQTWWVLTRITPKTEDPEIQGGREAEGFLQDLIGAHFNFRGAYLYSGRRVPALRQNRRREIDLIVCSPKMIHLIEVKNWSGVLRDCGSSWKQERRNGETVSHENLLTDNTAKRDVVVDYLRDAGIQITRDFEKHYICQKLFFMNPKLRLDDSISAHPDIITRDKLDGYLQKQRRSSWTEQMMCSIIDICLFSETAENLQRNLFGNLPQKQFQAIVEAISRLNTWDRLYFYGSKMLTGDVLQFQMGNRVWQRDSLSPHSTIRLVWTRGKLWGFFKAVTGFGSLGKIKLNHQEISLSHKDTLLFHPAGEETPRNYPLIEISKIMFG